MKKTIFAILLFPITAIAAEKCLDWIPSSDDRCSSNHMDYYEKTYFEGRCPTYNSKISIYGIAVCAKTPGIISANEVTARDTLEVSSTGTENTECWCRLLSPAVSRWVYEGTIDGACPGSCAHFCAVSISDSRDYYIMFRQELFSNLKD